MRTFQSFLALCVAVFAGLFPANTPAQNSPTQNCPSLITAGGTYNCNWVGTSANGAAVTVTATSPVTLTGTVTGPGDLIAIQGTGGGAGYVGPQVTVVNMVGIALDPGVTGQQRGRFIISLGAQSLTVTHNLMTGVSYGVVVGPGSSGGTMTGLTITNNAAYNMNDRASDGAGSYQYSRPSLGHFVYINQIAGFGSGSTVAWNQVVNRLLSSSVEDIINISESNYTGGSRNAGMLTVQNNYLEGAYSFNPASPPPSTTYSGSGIASDDVANGAVHNLNIAIKKNQVVETGNVGIALASGSSITVASNRITSCGNDGDGNSYAQSNSVPAYLWNFYATNSNSTPPFANNSISSNTLALVNNSGTVTSVAQIDSASYDSANNDTVSNNTTSTPDCTASVSSGVTNAVLTEWQTWLAKLANAGQTVGPQ